MLLCLAVFVMILIAPVSAFMPYMRAAAPRNTSILSIASKGIGKLRLWCAVCGSATLTPLTSSMVCSKLPPSMLISACEPKGPRCRISTPFKNVKASFKVLIGRRRISSAVRISTLRLSLLNGICKRLACTITSGILSFLISCPIPDSGNRTVANKICLLLFNFMAQKCYLSGLFDGSDFNIMSSPVLDLFSGFVQIDRQSVQPIYLQVAQQVINAVQRGYLMVGTKLPGSRALSERLHVHRKTVIAIYNELEAQGWVEVRPNKGTFIIHQQQLLKLEKPYAKLVSLAQYPSQTGYDFRKSTVLDSPFESTESDFYFSDGTPDIRLTQLQN